MGKGVIYGDNNYVNPEVDKLYAIGCDDQEFTTDDSNKVIFKNRALTVSEHGIIPRVMELSADFTTADAGFTADIYKVDASGANIVATLSPTGMQHTFIKIDGTANYVRLEPDSGNINGAANFDLTTQYQKVTAVFDGTDWFV